ncbi:hypothetical protein JCM30471_12500 [Desulfuromonas carbonis]|nr:cyclopropane-fatty-acyl-phospholipid synthase [Desulfuromonas sp. DDH964]
MEPGPMEPLARPQWAKTAEESFRDRVEALFDLAGVRVNGNRPWDIEVNDTRLFRRILAEGSLGLGEAYMDGWWDCQALDRFFHRVLQAGLDAKVRTLGMLWASCKARLCNRQSVARARQVGKRHYDIGNDLYRAMLDSRMNYSCGY